VLWGRTRWLRKLSRWSAAFSSNYTGTPLLRSLCTASPEVGSILHSETRAKEATDPARGSCPASFRGPACDLTVHAAAVPQLPLSPRSKGWPATPLGEPSESRRELLAQERGGGDQPGRFPLKPIQGLADLKYHVGRPRDPRSPPSPGPLPHSHTLSRSVQQALEV
jgi:hypothetical protein